MNKCFVYRFANNFVIFLNKNKNDTIHDSESSTINKCVKVATQLLLSLKILKIISVFILLPLFIVAKLLYNSLCPSVRQSVHQSVIP